MKSLYVLPHNNSELNMILNLHFGRFATHHVKTTLFYYLPCVYVWWAQYMELSCVISLLNTWLLSKSNQTRKSVIFQSFFSEKNVSIVVYRSDAASSKSALKVTFNFIQNLGGGGQYGDPSSFKEGHLVVQENHTLRKIRWCKGIR